MFCKLIVRELVCPRDVRLPNTHSGYLLVPGTLTLTRKLKVYANPIPSLTLTLILTLTLHPNTNRKP